MSERTFSDVEAHLQYPIILQVDVVINDYIYVIRHSQDLIASYLRQVFHKMFFLHTYTSRVQKREPIQMCI